MWPEHYNGVVMHLWRMDASREIGKPYQVDYGAEAANYQDEELTGEHDAFFSCQETKVVVVAIVDPSSEL